MIDIGMPYYRFGSKDSQDIDILIDYDIASGNETDYSLIYSLKDKYPAIKEWQINIIKIEDGLVGKSIPSKGSPDAVNNSLYETYHLHKQFYPFPIRAKLVRCKILAIVKCVRAVLTSFDKKNAGDYYTEYIRPKLKSNSFKDWTQLLTGVDLNRIAFENEEAKINKLKSLSFHIGQTISLINDIEIYTKQELVYWHPELLKLIKREDCNGIDLINGKLTELQGLIDSLDIIHHIDIVKYDNISVNFKQEIILQ